MSVGCFELQRLEPTVATELGEVLVGLRPGRRDDGEITVYKAMGHAVEDLVAAELILEQVEYRDVASPMIAP